VRAIRRLRARFNLGMLAAGFAVTVLMVRATEGGTEQVIAVTGILATFYFAWYYKAVERAETAGEITRHSPRRSATTATRAPGPGRSRSRHVSSSSDRCSAMD
jgi:hypothetical protein